MDLSFLKDVRGKNASVDYEKSKARAKAAWSKLGKQGKAAFKEETGVPENSIYRIFTTGILTDKMAAFLGEAANVSPWYLCAETDELSESTGGILEDFLQKKGLGKAKAKQKAKGQKRAPKQAAQSAQEEKETACACDCDCDADVCVSGVSEEEAVALLKSLYIRSKYDGGAMGRLNQITGWLVKY